MKRKIKIVPHSIAAAAAAVILWLIIMPLHRPWQYALCFACAVLAGKAAAYLKNRKAAKKAAVTEPGAHISPAPSPSEEVKVSPELDWVRKEGDRALTELGRLYAAIPDENVRQRIMRLTDLASKIIKDAEADPRDIPRIRRFLTDRLPETVGLLNEYDRMYSSGSYRPADSEDSEDIEKVLEKMSRDYAVQLDALFDQELLDVETDISAMESMLKSDGLTASDFKI
ncbi:MAG: 5-bromo-4-chloroindolyl phosphate hydrolysis family protein [Oscillospiraceae bacterium]|nr:5-bromo-4-chloroindolyl phosphate hydrolysis family protein [Oscillospiraceae bacterium]